MPNRPAKTSKSPATAPAVTGRRIAAKAEDVEGKIKAQRMDKTGQNTRIKGHVAARGQRAQAKRDSR
jgi:hypothetical protein